MWKIIKNIDGIMGIAALIAMLLCIDVQVFFRYVLDSSLEWPEEVARYAFIFAVFLGASYAAGEGRHLEIGVAKNLFGVRVKYWVTLFSGSCMTLFCAFLTVWGVDMVLFVKESDQIAASMNLPMYYIYMVIPIAMCGMGIRTLLYTRRTLCELRIKQKYSKEEAMSEMSRSW